MQPEPTGYRELHARLTQCGRFTNDARARLATAIQRAPQDATLTNELNKALIDLITADDAIYSLIHAMEPLALHEQRRNNAPRPN